MARILVIEDNLESMELMTYLLGSFGHQVIAAGDAEMGFAMLERESVDLVICDVHLPGMDGYNVAGVLKSDPTLNGVPLVAVTALAMVGDRDRILAAGFDGYISKPIVPETFAEEIEGFLPAAAEGAAERKGAAPPSREPRRCYVRTGARLLVVDDAKVNRELIRAILEPYGYVVTLAESVPAALKAADRSSFDLILCDLRLPEHDGLDLLDAFKKDARLSAIPFLIVTASRWADNERRLAMELGAKRFLLRPIEPHELLAEIAVCLEDKTVN